MKNFSSTTQTRNIIAASIGALIGLTALAWTLPNEAIVALLAITGLITLLSRIKPRGATTTVLCGLLGLACARLTISLIQ
ncbi:MAG TPA: hypothetical protein VIX90_10025 [Edaphobacter sp.]